MSLKPGRRTTTSLYAVFIFALAWAIALPAWAAPLEEPTPFKPKNIKGPFAHLNEEAEHHLLELDLGYIAKRTAGDKQLSIEEAGRARYAAANDTAARRAQARAAAAALQAYNGAWSSVGPNPIVQIGRTTNTFEAVSGRIGALAWRSTAPHTLILGAAQGGVWTYDPTSGQWTSHTDGLPSLAIGALAIAPSNQDVVYAGTGEGALSGDSYFGNGVMKSTDGGTTWSHVSGSTFAGVSISRIVVHPTNPNRLWAAVLRGRGGAHRTTPPNPTTYGIWESQDGGVNWTLRKGTTDQFMGATDLEIDPQTPNVLYASFWMDAIYKSTDYGVTWAPIMNGFPADADFQAGFTRFSVTVSHPAGQPAVLYSGFDYDSPSGHVKSRVWKSTNEGASWTITSAGTGEDAVEDYCGEQCFYDNVVEADPSDPNVVYALGQFNYGIGSGGIYRSLDGGATWKNLGNDLHPDYHAIAIRTDAPSTIVVGNDGGVWSSTTRGGRLNSGDPLSAADWQNLNGTVDPDTAAVSLRSDLRITQFTSIANVPTIPNRIWGGTQDNGSPRKSAASDTWFDVDGGDGGQVLVDEADPNFVFGTYFGISPYRFDDGGLSFFGNQAITKGIDLSDRSEFYIPWIMNPGNANQLFLGTYRVYRTNNAEAVTAGDVEWKPISPDLTTGCQGPAPNGARGCFLSAIGVSEGGRGIYSGSLEGLVYFSPDAVNAASPVWDRVDKAPLPRRPIARIAVDRSNDRIAYLAYNGFNLATPSRPGHIFKTADGGRTFTNVSGNLPDTPVNDVLLDPSDPNTLYAGTDVGPYVTYDGGTNWAPLGTGFPIVSIEQMALDPANRLLRAGTHGRGAWSMSDAATQLPALVAKVSDPGVPVGPGSNLTYTFTLRNIGNAAATGVTITDPIPAHTSFVSATSGGHAVGKSVVWNGLTVPAGGTTSVDLTVKIDSALGRITNLVNDGLKVTSAQGVGTTGSAYLVPIAPPHGVALSPTTQTDGTRAGQDLTYPLTVRNLGFLSDSYGLSTSGNTFPTSFLDATCTTPITSTGTLAPGATEGICVKVSVPAGAANATVDTATIKATSVADPSVSATATVKTIAVTATILLVDNDGNIPDTSAFYKDALTTTGKPYNYWDLSVASSLPLNYMKAHANIVWFTGASYPGPILPYEANLGSYLSGGGHLFMSGDDILDQAAGTTTFVHDFLHIDWDGSENQNDVATDNVKGEAGNAVTNGIGTVPLDKSVLDGADFSDEVTPIAPATVAFRDDANLADGLSLDTGSYKVVFLAFPFEEFGSASQKADLMSRVLTFFGA